MRINQNVSAFNAYRHLSVTGGQLSKSLERLSSGFRVNRAADDAAGLTKSEKLRAEVNGTRAAVQNAQDGISWVQTVEGALEEIHAILQRIRDLAVSAANTATTDGTAQDAEVDELVAEINSISARTTFAGTAVFGNYSSTNLVFHIGAGSGANHQLSISDDLRVSTGGAVGVFAVTLTSIDVDAAAETAISLVDSAIANVSTARSKLGAKQNRLEHSIANLNVALENLSASESRIRDADMAVEMVSFTRHQIMQQAGTAMLAQANQVPQNVLQLLRG